MNEILNGDENKFRPVQAAENGNVLMPKTPSSVIQIETFLRTEARKSKPPLKIAAKLHDKLA